MTAAVGTNQPTDRPTKRTFPPSLSRNNFHRTCCARADSATTTAGKKTWNDAALFLPPSMTAVCQLLIKLNVRRPAASLPPPPQGKEIFKFSSNFLLAGFARARARARAHLGRKTFLTSVFFFFDLFKKLCNPLRKGRPKQLHVEAL